MSTIKLADYARKKKVTWLTAYRWYKAGFQFYKIRNNWLKYNNIQPVGIYL